MAEALPLNFKTGIQKLPTFKKRGLNTLLNACRKKNATQNKLHSIYIYKISKQLH